MDKSFWLVCPLDYYGTDSNIPTTQYPVEILPRKSKVFLISSVDNLKQEIPKMLEKNKKKGLFRSNPKVSALVVSDDKKRFKVKLSKSLRELLDSSNSKQKQRT